ncbi:hypothetical protein ATE47_10960 [Chryseobacterium sp. IHB B 17019]|jgi:hypothetical protein|uniref:DUF3788 domain-containing protein n=1 Tax=Chryseobacterium sp. IHB B 17019 TaxID=1721091 RepID=UPI0007224097|nr:DUF3788 domain-containing protein [Chryseobacterium sp. IHB B 17019]ALR31014.1 hypothetical protein ATE47_10960 [Chryseobacterium sp. IHB B 17019]
MKSIFNIKDEIPTLDQLKEALGETYDLWQCLEKFTHEHDHNSKSEWHFSGQKFGWSLRVKDKKRVIIYLLPREKFFKAAFVFGQKAIEKILESNISESIKTELINAKIHAEGRGIRIEVRDRSHLKDIEKLIEIKIAH